MRVHDRFLKPSAKSKSTRILGIRSGDRLSLLHFSDVTTCLASNFAADGCERDVFSGIALVLPPNRISRQARYKWEFGAMGNLVNIAASGRASAELAEVPSGGLSTLAFFHFKSALLLI